MFIELAWAPEPSVTRGDAGGSGGEQGRNVFFALEQAAGEDGTFQKLGVKGEDLGEREGWEYLDAVGVGAANQACPPLDRPGIYVEEALDRDEAQPLGELDDVPVSRDDPRDPPGEKSQAARVGGDTPDEIDVDAHGGLPAAPYLVHRLQYPENVAAEHEDRRVWTREGGLCSASSGPLTAGMTGARRSPSTKMRPPSALFMPGR